MIDGVPVWLPPILGSAFCLGIYDICRKDAVRDNPVLPVLLVSTLTGLACLLAAAVFGGDWTAFTACTVRQWLLLLGKALLVGGSWVCVYRAMRELPVSIAAPIRASSPLWTLLGGMALYGELPAPLQAAGMAAIFGGYCVFALAGRREGIDFLRHPGIRLILVGTVLGASSALYDKYLLGVERIPRGVVQFYFSANLSLLLGAAWLLTLRRAGRRRLIRRWTLPLTGALLVLADFLYFYAVSLPETQIAILSLVRRCSCVVTFVFGALCFHEGNLWRKAAAMALILLGVLLLALAG